MVYYPPYHSKYNPIERCWGILETHWNGTLLETVDTVLHWARTMTWKAVRPSVHLLDKAYANGVRVAKKAGIHLRRDSWNMTAVTQKCTACPSLAAAALEA